MLPTSKDTCHPRKRMLLPGTAKTLTSPDIKMLHYSTTQCNEIYSEYDVNVAYIFQLTFPQRTYFLLSSGTVFDSLYLFFSIPTVCSQNTCTMVPRNDVL